MKQHLFLYFIIAIALISPSLLIAQDGGKREYGLYFERLDKETGEWKKDSLLLPKKDRQFVYRRSFYTTVKVIKIEKDTVLWDYSPYKEFYRIEALGTDGYYYDLTSPILDSSEIDGNKYINGMGSYNKVYQLPLYRRRNFLNAREITPGNYYEMELRYHTPYIWDWIEVMKYSKYLSLHCPSIYLILNSNGLECYPLEYRERVLHYDYAYPVQASMNVKEISPKDDIIKDSLKILVSRANGIFHPDSLPQKCLAIVVNNSTHPERLEYDCFLLGRNECLSLTWPNNGRWKLTGHFEVEGMDAFVVTERTSIDEEFVKKKFLIRDAKCTYFFKHVFLHECPPLEEDYLEIDNEYSWRDIPDVIRMIVPVE